MRFDEIAYGAEVAAILQLDGGGERLIPLVAGRCSSPAAATLLGTKSAADLFPRAAFPDAALAGLWTYFSAFDEAHRVAQDIPSTEGSLWHGILHRQEPDSGNAAYWFRRAGSHPVFTPLAAEAAAILERYPRAGFAASARWDPLAFVDFCDRARESPGSPAEAAALDIQRVEWQLLFDYCARTKG